MERLTVGTVVITPFPFSDLKTRKVRPAIILAVGDFGDLVLCQITSLKGNSENTVALTSDSFSIGGVNKEMSFARPDKLFTTNPKVIRGITGRINKDTVLEIKNILKRVFDL